MEKKKKHVVLHNARPGVYGSVIAAIAKENVCPFCAEHLTTYHKKPIDTRKYWHVTDNMYPYKPTKVHKLLIHRKHIEHVKNLTKGAKLELFDILTELGLDGGTILMCRFGLADYTGSSVQHLHLHVIQSDPNDPTYDISKGIITRIG